MRLPIRAIDPPDGIPAHHDFSGTGDRRSVFMADIANYPLIPADALNFVRIVRGQKLDTSIVDGEPNLDFYQLARFFV